MANTSLAPPFKVKALFDYASPHDDDLNFAADDIITVTEEEDADWYYGEYTVAGSGQRRQGIFPKNFVERIVVELPPRPSRPGGAARKKQAVVVEERAERGVEEQHVKAGPFPPPVNTASSRPSTGSTITSPVTPSVTSPVASVRSPQRHEERGPASPPPQKAPVFSPPVSSPPVMSPKAEEKKPSNKPPPPEKPSSFKDRLALFNKASTTPIAPYNPHKPPINFIKKPFVAPPPSKNSYVPPPNQHVPKPKRDEDSNYIRAEPDEDNARRSTEQQDRTEEERPKLALKDRIALLQTQQLDPSGGLGGGKPKRPPKPKRAESEQTIEGAPEDISHSAPIAEELESVAYVPRKSHDSSRDDDQHHHAHPRKKSSELHRAELHRDEDSSVDADAASLPDEHHPRPRPEREDKSDDGDDEGANDDTPDVASYDDDDGDNDEDNDSEEIDPEVARKIAIRERIAKMSGGMGMHGMFGPPMGIPAAAAPPPKKKKKKPEEEREREVEEYSAPVALPFVVQRPPQPQPPVVAEREESEDEGQGQQGGVDIRSEDEEDVKAPPPPHSPTMHPMGPRPMPTSPKIERASSPVPAERPVPPPPPPVPSERPVPPPPPPPVAEPQLPASAILSPSEGSASDDELSAPPSKLSLATEFAAPPPPPTAPFGRPGDPTSPTSSASNRLSQYFTPITSSPTGPAPRSPPINKRFSYQRGAGGMPPVPGGFPSPPPAAPFVSRPPPPPLPSAPPPPPRGSDASGSNRPSDEEEVTEYEADYDTDIGNKVAHRDALKGKEHGREEDDVTPLPSPVLSPQMPPPPPPMPPPVPGSAPPSRKGRQSMDMPRAAPPPPPPPQQQEEQEVYDEDDYDPYKYDSPRHESPPPPAQSANPPPSHAPPSRGRQSLDVSRGPPQSSSGRRSMDQNRPVAETIAQDVDLSEKTHWWRTPNTPPPIFQNRPRELYFEIEESTIARRGGRSTVKKIYVLFHDYSQTVITARYDPQDSASSAQLSQRHEPPPPPPRQDQLETWSAQFGARIHAGAKAREGTVVGDGDALSFIRDLFPLAPGILAPAGARSFGALVYANLANASVQQADEIRAGDVVTFRNARFQGHRGGLHQKYASEVGRPEHMGVVGEWDGTKKKLRVWEQGRDGRKVKECGYRLADLRSGEVKVWRGVGRVWVGWARE